MPKVSILIPVYNREKFIGECIDSALAQTYSDFEIVIVDNASTDDTWLICQEYAQKDSRVKLFQNTENIGPVLNWKRCFDEARGEFGKLLFSDDLISPEFITFTLPCLENSDVGFVFTGIEIGAEAVSKYAKNLRRQPKLMTSDEFLRTALFSPHKVPVSPGAAIFRLKDLRGNLMREIASPSMTGFSKHGAGPDLLLYLLTASQYPYIAIIKDELCFFRSHTGSITISHNSCSIMSCYAQARIWFASKHLPQQMFHRLLAYEWLQYCLMSRHFISLNTYIKLVCVQIPTVGVISVSSSLVKFFNVRLYFLLKKLESKISRVR